MGSGLLKVDVCDVYYRTAGEGPAVLFFHAGVADSRMWQHQMDLDGHRVIVFDQRGFGNTRWVPGPYSNREDALALLDHLGIDRCVVVGCSNGGEAAMQLALVAPEVVAGLVLVGAAPRGWSPEGGWADDPLDEEAMAAAEAGDHERAVELEARMWLAGPDRSLDEIDPDLIGLFRDMDLTPLRTQNERGEHVQTLNPPTNERLDQISAETLVIVGEHDYPDLVKAAHHLADRLSHRPAVILDGTAHLPSLEVPGPFNETLRGFLTTLDY